MSKNASEKSDTTYLEDCYQTLKKLLSPHGFLLNPYQSIHWGIQFRIFLEKESILLRIFKGKKGLKFDFSQANNSELIEQIQTLINEANDDRLILEQGYKKPLPPSYKKLMEKAIPVPTTIKDLIGIDESGKGDYFGPLVIAGAFVTEKHAEKLLEHGIQDSKQLSDKDNIRLAKIIKNLCPHKLIIIKNPSYNELYEFIKNLNHMLAWGHAKTIESMVKDCGCKHALSDKFSSESLIHSHLIKQDLDVTLYEENNAERFISVAAASILAREAFLNNLSDLSKHYSFQFPKGCKKNISSIAHNFIKLYGEQELRNVAKLHFKITKNILININKQSSSQFKTKQGYSDAIL